MKKVFVRGRICGASYDSESDYGSYIKNGAITPESRFRKELAGVNDNVELYINSEGGSVLAGCEMINALKDFRKSGKQLEITVGAMAFSMAANMVVMSGASKVKAYKNSKLMFHGCYTWTAGGADAHGDTKKFLDLINGDVIAALRSKGIKDCQAWFAEGRDHFISAQEAMALGIVDEIIDADDAPNPRLDKATSARMLAELGYDAAAFHYGEEEDPTPSAQENAQTPQHATTEPPPAPTPLPTTPTAQEPDYKAMYSALQSSSDKRVAALTAEITTLKTTNATLETELQGVKTSLSAEKAAHATTTASLDETNKLLAREKENHANIVGGAFAAATQPPATETEGKKGFERMLAAMKADSEGVKNGKNHTA